METSELKKRIVVVGGAGGIGQAVVRRYVDAGESVIIIDKNTLAEKISGAVEKLTADVTKIDDIKRIAEIFKTRGILVSHLVSLAGGMVPAEWPKDIRDLSDDAINDSICLNLTSHLWLVKHLMKDSANNAGDRSIVFVSSINALKGFGLSAYSAAKAGLLGAAHELACSLGPCGIRVNVILPGTVPTPNTRKEPKNFNALLKTTTLGRFASPEDIAAGCYFLTHMTNVITGQEIVIDAGQTVKGID
ncbi:MAG: SDR family oxidoreductase [bacterium]